MTNSCRYSQFKQMAPPFYLPFLLSSSSLAFHFRTPLSQTFDAMKDTPAYLYGDVDWPTQMSVMTDILRKGGLNPSQGRYAITIVDCEHFTFQEYGGDLGDPSIEADAESIDRMIQDARRVSSALKLSGVNHEFEIYNEEDKLVLTIKNGIEQGAQPDVFGSDCL